MRGSVVVTWGPRTPCFSRGGGGTAPAVGRVRAFLQVAARSSVATPQPPRHNVTCSCTKGPLFSDGEAPGSQQPALPPSQNAKTEGSGSHPPGTGLCCENLRPMHGPPPRCRCAPAIAWDTANSSILHYSCASRDTCSNRRSGAQQTCHCVCTGTSRASPRNAQAPAPHPCGRHACCTQAGSNRRASQSPACPHAGGALRAACTSHLAQHTARPPAHHAPTPHTHAHGPSAVELTAPSHRTHS